LLDADFLFVIVAEKSSLHHSFCIRVSRGLRPLFYSEWRKAVFPFLFEISLTFKTHIKTLRRNRTLKKPALISLLIITLFFSLMIPGFAQLPEDPAGSLPTEEEVTSPAPEDPVVRYTDAEFSALLDNEKLNVYLNTPELLPENFDPEPYMDIFYPVTQ